MRAMVWAAIAVALAGCAAQEEEPEDTSAPTPPTLEDLPEPPPEELAVQAYRNMWQVVVQGSHEGADDHPDLELYASGQALELTTQMLRGVEARGEPEMEPEAVETEADSFPPAVHIEDCLDDSQWVVEEETEGEGRSGPRLVTATVVSQSGQWLVDEIWLEDYGTC